MIHRKCDLHFFFIRHAQSRANLEENRIGGRSNSSLLTELGITQAASLGKALAARKVRFDMLYASTANRAIITAELVRNDMGHPPGVTLVEDLLEYSAGDWEGMKREEVMTPEVKQLMAEKTMDFETPNGESQRMVERRISGWLEKEILYNKNFVAVGEPKYIGIVSHGLTIKCLIHYITGMDRSLIWRIRLDNCSVSEFAFKHNGWWPICINQTYSP